MIPVDLLESLGQQLAMLMPDAIDADMVLNNLERFLDSSRSRLATLALFERDPTSLPVLLTLFGSSQYLSDLLVRDAEAYDALRLTEGQPIARDALFEEICGETSDYQDDQRFSAAIRRFKRRELLRIAYGDLVANQNIPVVTRQLSYVADAVVEATVQFVWRTLEKKLGRPLAAIDEPADATSEAQARYGDPGHSPTARSRFVVLALGKLGGNELNYSSDIDLIFVYESDLQTHRGKPNQAFFDRMARELTRLITEHVAGGPAYRVDWRLRPEGKQGPLTVSWRRAINYYENKGRSWERQAFVKARPIAGDLVFGHSLLQQLNPWIYQKRWSRIEIESMNALKRKIERRAKLEGEETNNVKTGFGGIRDIEFTIQFLQLLNGAARPDVQTTNNTRGDLTGCVLPGACRAMNSRLCPRTIVG